MRRSPLAYAGWRATVLGSVTEQLERDAVLGLAGPLRGLDVLDVGCGDGVYAVDVAERSARVSGLDRSVAAVRAARDRAEKARASVDLVAGDALALPFPAARFDVVLAVTVLCFVDDPARAVSEMARVLRPGGRLVLGDLGRWSAWGAWRRLRAWAGSATWRSAHFWSPGELRELLSEAGLTVAAERGAAFFPPLGMAARLLRPLDPLLGRITSRGAAFVAVAAIRAVERSPPRPHAETRPENT